MNSFEKALYMLPPEFRADGEKFRNKGAEEFRLRLGKQASVLLYDGEHALNEHTVSHYDIERTLEKLTNASIHTAADAMCEGYINACGLRIGVCGTAVLHKGELTGLKCFSSIAIRIPRECRGICDSLIDELYSAGYKNTLLISKPGGGKTTALRELIRRLSDMGYRLGVVDERNELGAADRSELQFELGRCTDVLTNTPKAKGAMMLLRGMNPEIIAMDEISAAEDISAVSQIYGCGVGILASAHAGSLSELKSRPLYKEMLNLNIFKYAVSISGKGSDRKYTAERI